LFTPSDFRDLFQPNYCERRIWLAANRPDLALEDIEFAELVKSKGQEVEDVHVRDLGPVERPKYTAGDMQEGFIETLNLIKSRTPLIYQGVLQSNDSQYVAIPDLLILDDKTDHYKIRDIKLAVNLANHPEIELGLGLCELIAKEVLGYDPIVEVVLGDGQIVSSFPVPTEDIVYGCIEKIVTVEDLDNEPTETVGWSKCNVCQFFDYCWQLSWESHDICTIVGVEQGMARSCWEKGIKKWEDIVRLGNRGVSDINFQRGKGTQRIGPARAEKIVRQAKCLGNCAYEVIAPIILPHGYSKGDRPIIIFDIENNIFEIGIRVNVYLWGLMIVSSGNREEQQLIVAPPGDGGDEHGWHFFLGTMSDIFKRYGDVPLIHYSSHEKTWVTNYVNRYGDIGGTGQKILHNLWDMYPAITASVALPVPSYSLKQIESFVGFNRSQEEYGGSWSIVRYNQYLTTANDIEAAKILDEIRTYNREDLLATYSVYKWLEEHCC